MSLQSGPTTTDSWKLWCLALTLLSRSEDERRELLAKQPHNERELLTRMQHIRTHQSIPVAEFLP